jgi:hypothetical protein
MRELKSLLAKCEISEVDFHPANHRVRCYMHIINICSSHIIASMTSTSTSFLTDSDTGSDDESDDSDVDLDDDIDELELADNYDHNGSETLEHWFTGMKHNPIR